jgi:chromosomal replication initiator protein
MLAMWLARKYTRAALGEIGEYFGRRSHSTVISAQRKIEGLVSKGGEISVADRSCHVEEAIRQVEQVLRTA